MAVRSPKGHPFSKRRRGHRSQARDLLLFFMAFSYIKADRDQLFRGSGLITPPRRARHCIPRGRPAPLTSSRLRTLVEEQGQQRRGYGPGWVPQVDDLPGGEDPCLELAFDHLRFGTPSAGHPLGLDRYRTHRPRGGPERHGSKVDLVAGGRPDVPDGVVCRPSLRLLPVHTAPKSGPNACFGQPGEIRAWQATSKSRARP